MMFVKSSTINSCVIVIRGGELLGNRPIACEGQMRWRENQQDPNDRIQIETDVSGSLEPRGHIPHNADTPLKELPR